MKRIWSALVCLVLALSLCVFEIVYTTGSADELGRMIESAREQYTAGDGAEGTVRILDCAIDFWSGRESVMNMFLYHDRVDDVGVKLKKAKSLAKKKSEYAEAEMIEAAEALKNIKDSELPEPENIL